MAEDSLVVYGVLVLSAVIFFAVFAGLAWVVDNSPAKVKCVSEADRVINYFCKECGCILGQEIETSATLSPTPKTAPKESVQIQNVKPSQIPNVTRNVTLPAKAPPPPPEAPIDPKKPVCGDGKLSVPQEQCDMADNPKYANASGARAYGCVAPKSCENCWCVISDKDGDGYANGVDNCPTIANAGQEDRDGDWMGNACDQCPNDAKNDQDMDGVCGNIDNCQSAYNPGQEDSDLDKFGDACDKSPINCVAYCSSRGYNYGGSGISESACSDQKSFSYHESTSICGYTYYKKWDWTDKSGNSTTNSFSCCCKIVEQYECGNCPVGGNCCQACPYPLSSTID